MIPKIKIHVEHDDAGPNAFATSQLAAEPEKQHSLDAKLHQTAVVRVFDDLTLDSPTSTASSARSIPARGARPPLVRASSCSGVDSRSSLTWRQQSLSRYTSLGSRAAASGPITITSGAAAGSGEQHLDALRFPAGSLGTAQSVLAAAAAAGQGGSPRKWWYRPSSAAGNSNTDESTPRCPGAGATADECFAVDRSSGAGRLRNRSSSQGSMGSEFGMLPLPGSPGRLSRMGSSISLLQLQAVVDQILVTDSVLYSKLQSGLRGINSLARETTRLEMKHDETGATCINQYVLVKTLGRGSFGKVKLCLNTLDGKLYAIKMIDRSYMLKTLQRPRTGLRRRTGRLSADNISSSSNISTSLGGFAAAAAPPPPLLPVGSFNARESSAGGSSSIGGPAVDDAYREIAIMKKLDHPHVVKLHEVIDPQGSQYMMLVMEYMEKGPVLKTAVQAGFGFFPEEVAANFFRQAAAGLDYLHYNRVVHGDLKPENLLVSGEGELRIADFGSSRVLDGGQMQQKLAGTPAFQAPEVIRGDMKDPFAVDIWALGVCLYCFLYGELPFQGATIGDTYQAIKEQEPQLPDHPRVSASVEDLLRRMLDKDPATRIQLPDILAHPWVTDGGYLWLPSLQTLSVPPGQVEVTHQEQSGAVDHSSVVSMIRAQLKECTFEPGQYLFRRGDPSDTVYFIMSGSVELVEAMPASRDGSDDGSSNEADDGMHSFTIDVDESLTLGCGELQRILQAGSSVQDGQLHLTRGQARDLRSRRKSWVIDQSMEVISEVLGPGQVVGEVVMEETAPPCGYSARAKEAVTALQLTRKAYLKALACMYLEEAPATAELLSSSSIAGGSQDGGVQDSGSAYFRRTTSSGELPTASSPGRTQQFPPGALLSGPPLQQGGASPIRGASTSRGLAGVSRSSLLDTPLPLLREADDGLVSGEASMLSQPSQLSVEAPLMAHQAAGQQYDHFQSLEADRKLVQ